MYDLWSNRAVIEISKQESVQTLMIQQQTKHEEKGHTKVFPQPQIWLHLLDSCIFFFLSFSSFRWKGMYFAPHYSSLDNGFYKDCCILKIYM